MKRAAVVDAHNDDTLIRQVGDTCVGRYWQGTVRGGHAVHIIDLAIGGFATVEFAAVPRGCANPLVAFGGWQEVVGLAQHGVGIAIAGADDGLYFGHRIGDQAGVDGFAGAILDVHLIDHSGCLSTTVDQQCADQQRVSSSKGFLGHSTGSESVRLIDRPPWHILPWDCSGL